MKKKLALKPGDRVTVRFGINDFRGTVRRVKAATAHPSVLVELDPYDDVTEPFISTFAVENVRLLKHHSARQSA